MMGRLEGAGWLLLYVDGFPTRRPSVFRSIRANTRKALVYFRKLPRRLQVQRCALRTVGHIARLRSTNSVYIRFCTPIRGLFPLGKWIRRWPSAGVCGAPGGTANGITADHFCVCLLKGILGSWTENIGGNRHCWRMALGLRMLEMIRVHTRWTCMFITNKQD